MATKDALTKAVAEKVKEYKKIAKAEKDAGRELTEGFRTAEEIQLRARQAVLAEMSAIISAEPRPESALDSGSDIGSVSAGPQLGGGSPAGARKTESLRSGEEGGGLTGVRERMGETETYEIGWKKLDGIDAKKVQDMVHRFEFEEYNQKEMQFEEWQRMCMARILSDLKMLGFVFDSDSAEMQVLAQFSSQFSTSGYPEEARDFVLSELYDEDFLVGQMIDSGLYTAFSKAMSKHPDRFKILREHDGLLRRSQSGEILGEIFSGLVFFSCVRKHCLTTNESVSERAQNFVMDHNASDSGGRSYFPPHIRFIESHFELYSKAVDQNELYTESVCASVYVKTMHKLFPSVKFIYVGQVFDNFLKEIANDPKGHKVSFLRISEEIGKAIISHKNYTAHLMNDQALGAAERHSKPQGFTRDSQKQKKGVQAAFDSGKKGGKGKGNNRDRRPTAPADSSAQKRVCFDFQKGKCKRDNCPYLHEKKKEPKEQNAVTPSAKGVCHFYARGKCRNGVNCPFLHKGAAQNVGMATQNVYQDHSGVWVLQGTAPPPAPTPTPAPQPPPPLPAPAPVQLAAIADKNDTPEVLNEMARIVLKNEYLFNALVQYLCVHHEEEINGLQRDFSHVSHEVDELINDIFSHEERSGDVSAEVDDLINDIFGVFQVAQEKDQHGGFTEVKKGGGSCKSPLDFDEGAGAAKSALSINRFALLFSEEDEIFSNFTKISENESFKFPAQVKLDLPKPPKARKGIKSKSLKNVEIPKEGETAKVEIPKNIKKDEKRDYAQNFVDEDKEESTDGDDVLVDSGANLCNFHSKRKGTSIRMRCLIRTVSGLLQSSDGKVVELCKGLKLKGTVNDNGPELIAACELTSGLNCSLVITSFQAYLLSKSGHKVFLKIKNGLPYLTKNILDEIESNSDFNLEYQEYGKSSKYQNPNLNRVTISNKSKVSKERQKKNLQKLDDVSKIFSDTSEKDLLENIRSLDGVLKLSKDAISKIGNIRHKQSRRRNGENSYHKTFQKMLEKWGDDYFTSVSADSGNLSTISLFNNRHFTVFVEEKSRKVYADCKPNMGAAATLENFKSCFSKREQQRLLHFHSDGGSEFLGDFHKFLKHDMDLHITTSNPYKPQENHIAEEKIGRIKRDVGVCLESSGFPAWLSEQAMCYSLQQQRNEIDDLEHGNIFSFGELCVYRAGPTASTRGRLGLYLHLCEDSLPSLAKNSYMLLDFRSLQNGILRFVRTDRVQGTDVDWNNVRYVVERIFSTLDFGVHAGARKKDDDNDDVGGKVELLGDDCAFEYPNDKSEVVDEPIDNFQKIAQDFIVEHSNVDENLAFDSNKVFDFNENKSIVMDVENSKDFENVDLELEDFENYVDHDDGGQDVDSKVAEFPEAKVVEFLDDVEIVENQEKAAHVENVSRVGSLVDKFNTNSPIKLPSISEKTENRQVINPLQFPDRGVGREAIADTSQAIFDVNFQSSKFSHFSEREHSSQLTESLYGSEFGPCGFLDKLKGSAFSQQEYDHYFRDLDLHLGNVTQCEHEMISRSDPRYYSDAMQKAREAEWQNFFDFDAIGDKFHISNLSSAQLKRTVRPVEVSSVKFPGTEKMKYKYRCTANGRNVKQELFSSINTLENASRRIMSFYAARLGLEIGASDAKSGYLQAEFPDGVSFFLHAPTWLKDAAGTVYEITRPIYGLPDSGRYFQLFVEKILIKLGFKQFGSFKGVFFRKVDGKFEMIGTYIDDLFMVSHDVEALNTEIINGGLLLQPVEKINFENSVNFNGIDLKFVKDENDQTYLVEDMDRYTQKIVETFKNMSGKSMFRRTETPGYNRDVTLFTEPSELLKTRKSYDPHTSLAQCLYLARGVRPEIANAVSFLARQVHCWSSGADAALEKLIAYLDSYPTGKLKFKLPPPDFQIGFENILYYSDADLGGDLTSSRSTGGDVTFLSWGDDEKWLLSWTSKMLSHKCTSTPWSELASLQRGLQSSALPSSHLCELITQHECPIRARQDNAAAIQSIALGYSLQMRYLARHSRLSITYLHSLFVQGANCISYVESGNNTSDLMTKALDAKLHWFHTLNLGMFFD